MNILLNVLSSWFFKIVQLKAKEKRKRKKKSLEIFSKFILHRRSSGFAFIGLKLVGMLPRDISGAVR